MVADYERSFIGSFATNLIEKFLPESNFELFFTVVKFENNQGYSLTLNDEEEFSVCGEHQLMQDFEQTADDLGDRDTKMDMSAEGAATLDVNNKPLSPTLHQDAGKNSQQETQFDTHGNLRSKSAKVGLTNEQMKQRRQEILKKGAIPEFV